MNEFHDHALCLTVFRVFSGISFMNCSLSSGYLDVPLLDVEFECHAALIGTVILCTTFFAMRTCIERRVSKSNDYEVDDGIAGILMIRSLYIAAQALMRSWMSKVTPGWAQRRLYGRVNDGQQRAQIRFKKIRLTIKELIKISNRETVSFESHGLKQPR